jgi:hypothetical protein
MATVDIVLDSGGEQQVPLQQVATSDRSSKNTNVTVNFDGTIVSAGLTVSGGALPGGPGEAFFQVNVFSLSGSFQKACLFAGYWYPGHTPAYPGSTLETPSQGNGRRYTPTGVQPAVGAEIADSVPAGAFWRLLSVEAVLVTSATVASRLTNFYVDDNGGTKTRNFIATDTTPQTAGFTRTHGYYEGNDSPSTASVALVDGAVAILAKFPTNLPLKYVLPPGSRLRTITTAIDAGDQYAATRYIVEEWIKPV